MTPMTALRRSRLLLLRAAGAALIAAVFFGYHAASDSGAEVVSDSSAKTGWKTIEYQGIRVDIPTGWNRSDMDDCEFRFEHWGPPDSPACGRDGGVAFYSSGTFDPAHGPGVGHAEVNGGNDVWAGYVDVGDFAVYASDGDREVVGMLLDSARATEN